MRVWVLFHCLVWSVCAQSNLATLSGRIDDPQKNPVHAAKVELKTIATGNVKISHAEDPRR